jgi:hypothetical protein
VLEAADPGAVGSLLDAVAYRAFVQDQGA